MKCVTVLFCVLNVLLVCGVELRACLHRFKVVLGILYSGCDSRVFSSTLSFSTFSPVQRDGSTLQQLVNIRNLWTMAYTGVGRV